MFAPGEDLARILAEWLEGDDGRARGRFLADTDVRASMNAAVCTSRWTMSQITALIQNHGADSIATLGQKERRMVVNALVASPGVEWVSYNLKPQGAQNRAS